MDGDGEVWYPAGRRAGGAVHTRKREVEEADEVEGGTREDKVAVAVVRGRVKVDG